MLTRKSQIEQLLEENDFNVRVTIYDPTKVSNHQIYQNAAWKEAIRDSLGGGIVNDSKLYSISVKTLSGVLLNNLNVSGSEIANTILKFTKTPQPIRITVKTTTSTRVWIIA